MPRYSEVLLRGFDRTGKSLELHLKRFAARTAQHEVDHLDGIVFLDRMKDFSSLAFQAERDRYLK